MESNVEKVATEDMSVLEKLKEVLSVYRNVYNAVSIVTEEVLRLERLGMTDEDVHNINNVDNVDSEELFELVGAVETFKENSEKILDKLI